MMTRIDRLRGFNPRQQEAVTAVGGPLLIVVGPDSGKTCVITHGIAAVTFTNKTVREMQAKNPSLSAGILEAVYGQQAGPAWPA